MLIIFNSMWATKNAIAKPATTTAIIGKAPATLIPIKSRNSMEIIIEPVIGISTDDSHQRLDNDVCAATKNMAINVAIRNTTVVLNITTLLIYLSVLMIVRLFEPCFKLIISLYERC